MNVATSNPFALLSDDVGVAPEPATQKKEAPAPAPATRGTQKSRGGPASRGGKYYARGGKPAQKDAPATDEPAPDAGKKYDGRGRGRGRGRGDGARGRGRQFDRHSATGKTDSDKKVHQGWGGDEGNTELKAEQAATTDAKNEWTTDAAPAGDWGAAPAGDAAAADAWGAAPTQEGEKPEGRGRKFVEEEEDHTLTLDQYLAQKKEKDAAIPKIEAVRVANDGAEDAFKGATLITKSEEEETYFAGKAKSAPKPRAKKEEKVFLEIEGRFERNERPGRGRGRGGDRGGDRGRGGNRGGRGGRQPAANPAINVDDETAFPSLS